MTPQISMYIIPGGRAPERKTKGAIGYDSYVRAVVSAVEMDDTNPELRKTIFDFQNIPKNKDVARHIRKVDGELVYRMEPNESILVGIGFITSMPFPMFYWVAPRSGLASRHHITVTNAPGTVDPDYRGEAGVLVYNRRETPFDIKHDMRIAQIIFQWAIIPRILKKRSCKSLGKTHRGTGGFGSTGLR